ncbi:hypothetical protein WICANDRAFT_78788 [Wickerhamomyces anomalus NRRL Y-366-8]|uniref:Uncharacterized protein n=1 Tax=Wickerhamomyces anomalus (strain ATCC 58044 / CBS 1984 / NCYC 433 / NRRL Y-366-8) TaxID=683960 RepID=A0A1E3P3V2_WICAA|nr:uncharacterized protein WICANDRAFT_78788 [Wickerhamomyces anomalus NRRL Y-366-8]ODQ60171.1 hypothetical protein WICANDRAFT_78788 [Wickerhamomyces anomalus NRRL Y-366-8]
MGNYTALVRIAGIAYLVYKLIYDSRELGRLISSYTGSKIIFTESESSLFAVLLAVIGVTDLVPYLEDNSDYFDSVVPIRFFAFFILAVVSYLGDFALLNSPLVLGYSILEAIVNGLMMIDF